MKFSIRKNVWKKVLALMICIAMTLGLFPQGAIAAENEVESTVVIAVKDEEGEPVDGAHVSYSVSDTFVSDGETSTDENGIATISFMSGMGMDVTISATITKDGFHDAALNETFPSGTSNSYEASMTHTSVYWIDVEPTVIEYTGDEFDAATISGVRDGDEISYKLDNGEWTDTMPKIKEADDYDLEVYVESNGYSEFSTTVHPKVNKRTFTVGVEGVTETYDNGKPITLVNIDEDDLEDGDVVTYTIDGEESNVIPARCDVGVYEITVRVKRGSNYEVFETTCTSKIESTGITGLSAVLYEGTYDEQAHEAVVSVNGKKDGDVIEYRINDGDWSTDVPMIKDADTYSIGIRVTRSNYDPTVITELAPQKASISKAEQNIQFKNEHSTQVDFDKENPEKNVYDFSAEGGSLENPEIVYSVVEDGYESEDFSEIATIDENGILTIHKGGPVVKVIATVKGNDNYEDASVSFSMTVMTDEVTFKFNESTQEYILGTSITASKQAAVSTIKNDRRETTYTAKVIGTDETIDSVGLKQVVSDKGRKHEIRIQDVSKLVEGLNKSNPLRIVVQAKREQYKGLPAATISFELDIKFGDTPSRNIVIKDPSGNILTGPNGPGWYNTELTVELEDPQESAQDPENPVDLTSYKIAKTIPESYGNLTKAFTDSFVLGEDEQGEDKSKRVLYYRNQSTGAISAPVTLDMIDKLDCTRPDSNDIEIIYNTQPVNVFDRVYNYFNGVTQITFKGKDEVSGIDHFTWSYQKEANAVGPDLVEAYEPTNVSVSSMEQYWDDTEKKYVFNYYATITLPKNVADQIRGCIEVTATDEAGLTSNIKTDDGRVIVVDTIAPTRTVAYSLADGGNYQAVNGVYYYSNNVKFAFEVDESNFRSELVQVTVEKDGNNETKNLSWTKEGTVNKAELILTGEGDYRVRVQGTDPSGNPMNSYTSPKIVIDKTNPVISFSYSNGNNQYASADNEQTAMLTITEHNFRASDIEVKTTAKNIKGEDVENLFDFESYLKRESSWTTKGDAHTVILSSEFVDAIYNMEFDFKDLALNTANHKNSGEFIVDRTEPSIDDMEVIYSTPITETILETLTLGFYNPSVDVTFVAKDLVSGVGQISWDYKRQKDVSETNVEKYEQEDIEEAGGGIKQDENDPSRFTATVTLPKNEAEQLRGNLAFTATDKYSNSSDKLTDNGTVIIVDTIAPEMTAEYTEASNTKDDKLYYNKDFTITLDVTEANFFKEDVQFEISRDGGAFSKAPVEWTDQSTDKHIGVYTISAADDHSNDGDYVIRVNYTDRSNNKMATYTSKTIVMDTIKPTIDVRYSTSTPVNTLRDSEDHNRNYFNTTQIATVTIHEHNFDPELVTFDITAKDASGNALTDGSSKSTWSQDGDDHILTITYPGDANYTFDIDCEDLATNKADDYQPDYFTVDTTAPTNLNVSYSQSILDIVLSGISFGFYNSKVTVTIQATDDISMINKFNYSYVKAPGVSSVNSELLNQLIEEAEISRSDGYATGTAQFEIPKWALDENNQFNGNVKFSATNRSGLESNELDDDKRIVVDNISPTSTVEFNAPVNVVGGISYYDGAVNCTITINEANFYSEDVDVSVTKDGAGYSVSPSWSDDSADIHVGTFSLTEDGDYFVTINYTDKSNNQMATYTSEQLTVDTLIEEPVITINGEDGNGKAYKDQVIPAISFSDQNFDSYVVKLTRTRYNKKDEDVTDEFITPLLSINDKGGSGTFDTFKKEPGVDGIYTLTVSMTDRARHTTEKTIVFTVNRFGSVYEFNDYLIMLIKNGGGFVNKVEDDLVITEYNADKLLEGSLVVDISRDGKPLDNVVFTATPEINDQVAIGESGWYQYRYTISKENFKADGTYKVSISSKDATGNSPETSNFEDRTILFRVDSTPPEISSISGLEKSIINAQNVNVKFNVYDSIGLAKVTAYVDDEEVLSVTDFANDYNNYQGEFTLSESGSQQNIRIVAEDLAGNITDTSTDGFREACAYSFNPQVIVSTNPMVRAMAWAKAHAAAVGVSSAVLLGALFFIILLWRRRKEEEEEEGAATE